MVTKGLLLAFGLFCLAAILFWNLFKSFVRDFLPGLRLRRKRSEATKAVAEAKHAYEASLKVLRDSKSSDARVAALEAGRKLSAAQSALALLDEHVVCQVITEEEIQNDLSTYGAKD